MLHRDVKPENFVMGRGENADQVYLLDFGLAKRYVNSRTHMHIPYVQGKSLIGTARYATVNTHLGIGQSRRDDLESLAYTLIFLLRGNLPWQGIKGRSQQEKYDKIMEQKMDMPVGELCKGLPIELARLLYSSRNLKFDEVPEYGQLKNEFRQGFKAVCDLARFDYDWNVSRHRDDAKKDTDSTRADLVDRKAQSPPTSSACAANNQTFGLAAMAVDGVLPEKRAEEGKAIFLGLIEEEGLRGSGDSVCAEPELKPKVTAAFKSPMEGAKTTEGSYNFLPLDISERDGANAHGEEQIPAEREERERVMVPTSRFVHNSERLRPDTLASWVGSVKRAGTHDKQTLGRAPEPRRSFRELYSGLNSDK